MNFSLQLSVFFVDTGISASLRVNDPEWKYTGNVQIFSKSYSKKRIMSLSADAGHIRIVKTYTSGQQAASVFPL